MGWGEDALKGTVLNNFCDELKDELRELSSSLDSLITLCRRVDDHLQAQCGMQNSSSQDALVRLTRVLVGKISGSCSPLHLMISAKITIQAITHSLGVLVDLGRSKVSLTPP